MVTLWLTCLTVVSSIKSLTTLTFSIDACSAILTRWVTNTYSKHNYIKNKKGSRRSTKLLTIQPSWLLNPYTITFFFYLFFFYILPNQYFLVMQYHQLQCHAWCFPSTPPSVYVWYLLLLSIFSRIILNMIRYESDTIVILLKLLILSHLLS